MERALNVLLAVAIVGLLIFRPWGSSERSTGGAAGPAASQEEYVFIGVSAANALPAQLLKHMAPRPVVFALANPDPEILPAVAHALRDDLIMATGRSDFPNQVNNALCFPYLFRGALDARARQIDTAMQIAAAEALAELAREPVPAEVLQAYGLSELCFGKEYIIPKPFDPRLLERIPPRVAQAARRQPAG